VLSPGSLSGVGVLLLQREVPEHVNLAAAQAAAAAGVPVLLVRDAARGVSLQGEKGNVVDMVRTSTGHGANSTLPIVLAAPANKQQ